MNKAELLADLTSKTLKTPIQVGDFRTVNGGDHEYEYQCTIEVAHNTLEERIVAMRIINPGTAEEKAFYVHELPCNRESIIKEKLLELQAQGTVTANDLTHLGIKFADLNLNGARIFVTILNEETIIIAGA